MTRIALTILVTCLSLAAQAQLYKCKHPDGTSTFQDSACPDGVNGTKLAEPKPSSTQTLTLTADSLGHFHTRVSINDVAVMGVIDTGASLVTISAATARDMGIPLEGGKVRPIQTANGIVATYLKVVPTVKIGDLEMFNVEVCITAISPTLIGMNVLKRFKMNQENGQLILSKQW